MTEEVLKNLKECLVLGFDVMDGIDKSLANGRWDPSDAFNFSALIAHTPAAVDDITLVPSEIKRASPSDWQDLVAWASGQFDLDDDVAEAKVEAALEVVAGLMRGWAKWPKAVA